MTTVAIPHWNALGLPPRRHATLSPRAGASTVPEPAFTSANSTTISDRSSMKLAGSPTAFCSSFNARRDSRSTHTRA